MNYDYLIRHSCYSLDHPEGKSLSAQNPLYRLETQIADRYPGESLIFNAAMTKPRPNGLIVDGLPLLVVHLRFTRGSEAQTHPFPSRQYPSHLLSN